MPREILEGWKNFLKFNLNYFSVGLLVKTFFYPWRKYKMSYGKGLDFQKNIEVFFSNLIFRLLGAIIRSGLIAAGLIAEVFVFFGGLIWLVLWVFSPIILLWGLYFGFKVLF
ncbi:MAG: hypothetical protein PHW72_01270 [Candidatus Pacebacteria bacterium]|nr:hypothetical protein [Candidatus Paceibacterota bacterium]